MKHGKTRTTLLWEGALAAATQELGCDLGEEELDGQRPKGKTLSPFGCKKQSFVF